MFFSRQRLAAAAASTALLSSQATAQTYSACNPLTSSSCPANTALGMSIDVDFTQGEVNSFVASGGDPTYGSDGVTFTVAKSGDSPQLASVFYIMFGRVEISLKAAPGAGIVSSLVLQSDCLDEIDNEWLGSDSTEVQTNYFGKGITGSYNRGRFHATDNNQNDFITYVIDWTSERIVWTVDETVVRTQTAADAETDQYPQTPMQVKFGAWAGGDPSNDEGTIGWARGPTDFTQGPFSMAVKNVKITDYSTGTDYTYGDTSGTWGSIQAQDGEVNGNLNGAGTLTTTAVAGDATSTSSANVPAGGIGGTSTQGSAGLPDGWYMTSEGKMMPSSSATVLPAPLSSPTPSVQLSPAAGASGVETITTYDDRGMLTTMTAPSGFATMPKSYDSLGFPVTATAAGGASQPAATGGSAAAISNEEDAGSQTSAEAPDSGSRGLFHKPQVLAVGVVSLALSTLYILV